MSSPDDDVQSWFDEMPDKVQGKMSAKLTDAANKLAGAIKAAAPRRSGALQESVQVRQDSDGTFWITAGGDLTTKEVRKGSGVMYDYAMATEFGTKNENAEPFFYNTVRRVAPELQDDIEDAINDALND